MNDSCNFTLDSTSIFLFWLHNTKKTLIHTDEQLQIDKVQPVVSGLSFWISLIDEK